MQRYQARESAGHLLPADAARARKREFEVLVRFATGPELLQTPEGPVPVSAGDAIVTSRAGDQWPVGLVRFVARYRQLDGPRYLSLPIAVRVQRQDQSFEVLLSDGRSLLRGQPGDWLVDYGDGSLGVVSAAAFAASYDLISSHP